MRFLSKEVQVKFLSRKAQVRSLSYKAQVSKHLSRPFLIAIFCPKEPKLVRVFERHDWVCNAACYPGIYNQSCFISISRHCCLRACSYQCCSASVRQGDIWPVSFAAAVRLLLTKHRCSSTMCTLCRGNIECGCRTIALAQTCKCDLLYTGSTECATCSRAAA